MTTKHTPGPWVVGTTDGHATYNITGPCGTLPYIARIPAGRLENADNARLISAAPDLLAALELTMPILESHCKYALDDAAAALSAARAAAARAKAHA